MFCNLVSVKGAIVYNLHHFPQFNPFSQFLEETMPIKNNKCQPLFSGVLICIHLSTKSIHINKAAQSRYLGGGSFHVSVCVCVCVCCVYEFTICLMDVLYDFVATDHIICPFGCNCVWIMLSCSCLVLHILCTGPYYDISYWRSEFGCV